ncbi:protein FLORAL ORGAN NUMBER2-like [Sorghum bicolor]|uniref:protein FLORAL ORGAN NUMBER2-like n=1 Tax=Sorghum bicolor TaxID=4558 RepID=UPI00081ABBC9|nr:protein FLORAL ORGAN NUMBER2-like [Sorghum bicolor]|eukprot:XP_021317808.1 protein FLORAL ORGAN NUMBER2-like [Sorghum bicolor]
MARFSLCLAVAAAAACCCLALLLPPVQGRRPGTGTGTGRDHRLLFPEPRLDAEKPTEQQRGEPVKKAATPPSAGGVVTAELRWVPGGANPLHNHGSSTRQDKERTPPAAAAAAAAGGSVSRPELRTTPWSANPLHN